MRRFIFAVLLLLPVSLFAQEDYTWGSYWTVTSVETKPGHFDDYIADLKANWRKSLEMQKAEGHVLSYRMFSNVNGREGEPDLWLFVEHKSAGSAYDLPFDYVAQEEAVIRGMTLDQHRALAERFIDMDHMIYLVVGDAQTQMQQLRGLGFGTPIQLDPTGNRVR